MLFKTQLISLDSLAPVTLADVDILMDISEYSVKLAILKNYSSIPDVMNKVSVGRDNMNFQMDTLYLDDRTLELSGVRSLSFVIEKTVTEAIETFIVKVLNKGVNDLYLNFETALVNRATLMIGVDLFEGN